MVDSIENKQEIIDKIIELNVKYSNSLDEKQDNKILQKIKALSKKADLYDIDEILKTVAQYYMIIGIRSNGKTYGVLDLGIKNYCQHNEQMAIIRRWDTDFTGKRGKEMFSNLINNKVILKWSKGKWNTVIYRASQWFLAKKENDEVVIDDTPFCHGFALNVNEHDKSTSFPKVTTILFDEFLSRKGYLNDEFIEFMNTVSTIIRHRTNVKVFMCGNTVNKYSPYFNEMGLYNIKTQKEGTIDVYKYGESGLTVAVEYCALPKEKIKKEKTITGSEIYFAFNNPKLQMITTGAWEIDIYPHLLQKYKPKEVIAKYYIEFDKDILECEVVKQNLNIFTFIHRKTSPLKELPTDLIYTQRFSDKPNITRRINKPRTNYERKIWWLFTNEKVFYQDNEVGEIVRNYIQWCSEEDII